MICRAVWKMLACMKASVFPGRSWRLASQYLWNRYLSSSSSATQYNHARCSRAVAGFLWVLMMSAASCLKFICSVNRIYHILRNLRFHRFYRFSQMYLSFCGSSHLWRLSSRVLPLKGVLFINTVYFLQKTSFFKHLCSRESSVAFWNMWLYRYT